MDFQKEKILVKATPRLWQKTRIDMPNQKEVLKMESTVNDKTYVKEEGTGVIYLAGGCFWGMEKLMQSIPGVIRVTSGYANGHSKEEPTYEMVCTGRTGYRETVRVEYKTNEVSLHTLLFAYFNAIDPTIKDRQGNDRGSQYQTGIYYIDRASESIVKHVADIERTRYKTFAVEIKPLESFYEAEEYHQDYLDKNPCGYCHITKTEIEQVSKIIVDPAKYIKPADTKISEMLTDQQYSVTQRSATEPPFENELWDHKERGIYVDIVTGEPLFSSKDKFDSSCGWPAFSKGIDANTLVSLEDDSCGMRRTEVRSRAGNSHLGHVFQCDPDSPNGTRFCINSAALRFIPYDKMEEEGYGYLLKYV